MTRAIITAAAMVLIVATVGSVVLLVGLVRPSNRLFALSAALWARVVLFLSGTRLTVEGDPQTGDGVPRFYMANHQSALDIPILVSALGGNVRFMAKNTLFRIPVFGWVLWRYGFAPINRSSARETAETLDRMLERLRKHPVSFAVFPEGTRTRDGKLLPFRRGTMKIGQRSGFPIVPVTISGSLRVHHRDRFAAHPGPVRVMFHEPIPPQRVSEMSPGELHDRVVGVIARELGQPQAAPELEPVACMAAEAS